jgi:hypothetical protein
VEVGFRAGYVENNPGIVQNSISSNQSVTVLGQEQTFHKFDVHSFSILPLILVFSAFYVRTIKELILI